LSPDIKHDLITLITLIAEVAVESDVRLRVKENVLSRKMEPNALRELQMTIKKVKSGIITQRALTTSVHEAPLVQVTPVTFHIGISTSCRIIKRVVINQMTLNRKTSSTWTFKNDQKVQWEIVPKCEHKNEPKKPKCQQIGWK
jgi:hypothetical protein